MDVRCQDKREDASVTAYNSIGNNKKVERDTFLITLATNLSMLITFKRVSKVAIFQEKYDFPKKKKYRIGDKK